MADGEQTETTTEVPAEEPTGEAVSTPEAEAEAPAVTETPEETFDRKYVEELRQESAKYRTRAKDYEDAFEGYDDDTKAAMLDLARELNADPHMGSKRMVEVAKQVLGEDGFRDLLEDKGPKPLTEADVERKFKEREQAQAQEQAVQDVMREAKDLGYAEGTPDQAELFWFAHNKTEGDLSKAHEAVQARKQAAVDEYLKGKEADADAFPTPTTAGSGSTGGEPPKDFGSAREALMARLAGKPGE